MGRGLVWGTAVATAGLWALPLALVDEDRFEVAGAGIASVAAAAVGALVVTRRPAQPVGWLLLAIGVLPAIQVASRTEARRSVADGTVDVHTAALGWLASWMFFAWLVLLFVVLPLTFPDGRLPGPRWRPVAWGAWTLAVLVALYAFAPGPLDLTDGEAFPVDNPLGVPAVGGLLDAVGDAFFPALLALCLVAVASLVVRWRRGAADVRQQLRWVVAALALLVVALLVSEVLPPAAEAQLGAVPQILVAVALAGVPLAAGVAVLRHRLWDLDVVISRVAVHAVLVLGVTVCYVAAVAAAGAVFGGPAQATAGVLVAAGAALVLQPVRARLQERIDRVAFGFRSDPAEAVARLAQVRASTAQPAGLLPRAAEEVAHALRMERVAVDVPARHGWTRVAVVGPDIRAARDRGSPGAARPGGRPAGAVLPSRRLTAADDRLLDVVSQELAGCVEGVRLHEELLASRAALVSAREEERRRLRRDLHDGLGSALTGVILKLQAAGPRWLEEPEAAAALTAEAEDGARGALTDIRRLVYGLRPPALDELGLTGALQHEAERLSTALGVVIRFQAPPDLQALPAAVEVAAYRVVMEALNNVGRHAAASSCGVRLQVDEALEVEVRDDGIGLPDGHRPGVGLTSIRERAEELGGSWTV